MKYLDPKFSTPANSRAFVEGWDRCFGEEVPEEETPAVDVIPVTEGESRVVE